MNKHLKSLLTETDHDSLNIQAQIPRPLADKIQKLMTAYRDKHGRRLSWSKAVTAGLNWFAEEMERSLKEKS